MCDAVRKGRHRFSVLWGEANPQAKITRVQVGEIRKLLAQGVSQYAIASQYEISQTTVSDIKRGKKRRNG
jgi:DNA invertase Pin-like site-specific DNA recombinase